MLLACTIIAYKVFSLAIDALFVFYHRYCPDVYALQLSKI